MSITYQLILILSAIGSLNGFLVAGYLWFKTPTTLANRFLGALLLMISIRTFKSVFFYFNPDLSKVILQIGLSACFFIGPLLYFFCLSFVNHTDKSKPNWKIHLGVLFFVMISVGILFPYHDFSALWGGHIYLAINVIWLLYLLLSLKVIMPTINACMLSKRVGNEDVWLFSVFMGNLLIWVAYFTASYTSYIVGALSFSFVLVIMVLLIIFRLSDKKKALKYSDKIIAEEEAKAWLTQLTSLMEEEKLYKNSMTNMPQLAKKLGMSTPKFSQLLNDNLNKSFSVFINEYRIEEAKKLLSRENPPKMEDVAEQCGFNSQSTFYSAFKKITSLTPAKFKAQASPNL